ncbi:hypothetical protein BBJ28_00008554 [Nothophytophthora sp. Chile5]|nr:hypothetical protein BBJ28_00008554 [Nothophytophthora sp. Chile5]
MTVRASNTTGDFAIERVYNLGGHGGVLVILRLNCYGVWPAAAVSNTDLPSTPPQVEMLEGLRLLYPAPNAQYKSPLTFRFQLLTPDLGQLVAAYAGHHWICLQLDGAWRRCIGIDSAVRVVERIDAGNHTVRIVLSDSPTPETGRLLRQSEEVAFVILSDEDFESYMRQQRLDDLALYGSASGDDKNIGLLDWFRLQQQSAQGDEDSQVTHEVDAATGEIKISNRDDTPSRKAANSEPPFLIIGVKTRLVAGFPFRQAIRQTWASQANLPREVRVFFAGCRLPADATDELRRAVTFEQRMYGGDLLTDALACDDSYAALTEKVKEFLHFVGSDLVFRRAEYVMIADEDVYLRADELATQLVDLGPLHDLYAGHVKEGHLFRPERDPQRRYYLPESEYPIDEFPPFAWGPHYLMSMDVVEFIADNREELQGLRGLDDVSVALWLLAIQVHPQHLDVFKNLREAPCTDDIVAYADLGPSAMRVIQSNLRSGRSFCHGFNALTWDKDAFQQLVSTDSS